MVVLLAPHAEERMAERGASRAEIEATVQLGERFPAKHGRIGFRRLFVGAYVYRGRAFDRKTIEAYVATSGENETVVTVIVKYSNGPDDAANL